MSDEASGRQNRQLAAETSVRNTFQILWPAQHALAWIITGSETEVREIDVARELDLKPAWEVLREIAERYRREGETTENVLWRAFGRLAAALGSGGIKAWRSALPYTAAVKLDSDAFIKAGLTIGTNSCGLLGVALEGDAGDFVLMRPEDVKATIPAEDHDIAFPGNTQRAVGAKRRGRTPGSGGFAKSDALLFTKMQKLIDDGDASSANDAARILAPTAKGASLASRQDRLRKGFLKLENNGEK